MYVLIVMFVGQIDGLGLHSGGGIEMQEFSSLKSCDNAKNELFYNSREIEIRGKNTTVRDRFDSKLSITKIKCVKK